ncbi:MAG TPA: DeoR/GlpR family DNA-binding transcription regulator [Beijerinckiaceae bacterium]|jgi:DeoR/GlpR family transcriptional regulator of sugar metabolism
MARPIAARRHDEILKRIARTGTVSVEELATAFGVSRETIRRDLKALADRGRVDVVHGGAARRQAVEAAFDQRSQENAEGKAAIGRAAAALVEDGMVVLLDSGTTALEVARALADKRNLTVCTNALANAQLLCRVAGARVHMLGGEIDATEEATVGVDAIAALDRFRIDVAFVGVGGLSHGGDVTDYTLAAAEQRSRMILAASRAYILVDHTKFGRLTPIRIAEAERATALIVDRDPPAMMAESLERRGVQAIVAATR